MIHQSVVLINKGPVDNKLLRIAVLLPAYPQLASPLTMLIIKNPVYLGVG